MLLGLVTLTYSLLQKACREMQQVAKRSVETQRVAIYLVSVVS